MKPDTRDGVVNAMTIDVEDYFQVSAFDRVVKRGDWETLPGRVVSNTERLLQIFDEENVVATFFVLGWVAERYPQLVRRISAAGHEVASHGYAHRLIYHQTREGFRDDIRKAKSILEGITGEPVAGYRAPSFSITRKSLWAMDVLIEQGYTYDASVYPIRHDRYGIANFPRHSHVFKARKGSLLEVPGSTVRFCGMNWPIAGGGYFRILPYEWTQAGIAHLNKSERRPAVFYLHPWEIDPDQPRLQVGRVTAFRHYRNLGKTEQRLRRLLKDFRFGPLRDLVAGLNLSVAPIEILSGAAPELAPSSQPNAR